MEARGSRCKSVEIYACCWQRRTLVPVGGISGKFIRKLVEAVC